MERNDMVPNRDNTCCDCPPLRMRQHSISRSSQQPGAGVCPAGEHGISVRGAGAGNSVRITA